MNFTFDPHRRRVLQIGGVVAMAPLFGDLLTSRPAAAAAAPFTSAGVAASSRRTALSAPALSQKSLWYGTPATDWQSQALPIGNGRLGGMIFANPDEEVVQFNEQSLWGGVNDYDNALMGQPDGAYDTSVTGFGSYRDFGTMRFTFAAGPKVTAPGGPYRVSGSEGVDRTYDGNSRTKWCIDGPPATVLWQAELPDPATVTDYSFTSANDVPARDPQEWTLSGSQDGVDWTVLDTRTGAPFESRFQAKQYTFDNATAYRYYRFTFVPKAGVSHFQVSEISLGGVSLASGALVYVSSPSGASAGTEASADLARSVDGDPATAWRVAEPGDGVQWQLDLPAKAVATSYVLTAASDAPEHDPRSWRLEASNDGVDWVALDSREPGAPFAARQEAKSYTFANSTAFVSYRFTFATASATSPFAIGEVALVGPSFDSRTLRAVTDYRRGLDTAVGVHVTQFGTIAGRVIREAFASRTADVMVLRYTTDAESGISGVISLASAQEQAPTGASGAGVGAEIGFRGVMANALQHACTIRVVEADGDVSVEGATLRVAGCHTLTLVLDARTDYKMSAADGWRGDAPESGIAAALGAAAARSFAELRDEHTAEVSELMSRATVKWGETDAPVLALSTSQRLARYKTGASDPTLEQAMYDYGRYLLLSSSRPGGLPANLQGLWNNSNQPPWASDYHTNINVQMNYWGAETTNLAESHTALIDFVEQVAVPSRVATRNAFGQETRGWTARTSQSIFGGNSWEWNTVASAWYAQHIYEHWAFTQDKRYLRETAHPMIKEICEFWEDRLEEDADGRLVAPDGWSPEHGPREDGVMYDQQIIWDLFQNYLDCAEALGVDTAYRKRVAEMQERLAPNKIGRWGQLQEWQRDLDDPNDIHRHTSHLFAVYPGRQITDATPELAAAALVSLKARCGEKEGVPFTEATVSGDSRRSWTWPWRTALFARLGDAERARIMLRGLLSFNTLQNLFCDHPPFQMDGNFGISGAVTEMLLQSHQDVIHLLPALPEAWQAEGSFSGLRARGGYEVSCEWRDGRVVSFDVVADRAPNQGNIIVRVDGVDHKVKPANPKSGQPMRDKGPVHG